MMGEPRDFPRKQRSATASNLEDTIAENPISSRRRSFINLENRRSSNPFLNWRLRKQRRSADFSTTSLAHAQKNNTVNVYRPVYTQQHFDRGFGVQEENQQQNIKNRLRKCVTCNCSKQSCLDFLYGFFPFLTIFKGYSPREDLVGDLIAGMTVGIMNVPQGMAYALLASMPPIYGLYVSFFPVLIYFFFGGSRHISVGTFAVVSLMVGSAIDSQMDTFPGYNSAAGHSSANSNANSSELNTTTQTSDASSLEEQREEYRMGLATTLALLVGLCQLVMGICRLGFVTIYLADPLISGFTTGAACHVFTSQVKYVLGITVKRHNGALKLVYTYVDLFKNITTVNFAELIIAAICIITLALVKECINARFREKLKMPVPIDLIVVVLGTVISYFADLNGNFNVTILGAIPVGFKTPAPPPMQQVPNLLASAFTISVVAFAISVSMSKIFAKKHNYEIDANQEFLALGISNAVSSMFSCFPSCASLSRSVLQETQGGKTQLAGLFSASLILVVLVAVGPYFETLPNSVLASIILVALKGMFKQFTELKRLWYISFYDFSIWLVTWLAVVFIDVDLGLAIGVAFGLLTVVFRTQYPNTCILARVPHTDLYKDRAIYPTVQEVAGVKIFRVDASLYYANVEHFRKRLYKLTEANPRSLKLERCNAQSFVKAEMKQQKKEEAIRRKQLLLENKDHEMAHPLASEDCNMDNILPADKRPDWPRFNIHHIIIDCGMMSYVDSVGVNMLITVYMEYKDVDVEVLLVNCKASVREMLKRCSFYDKVPPDNIYLTIHDAVIAALSQRREILEEVNKDTKIVSRPNSILITDQPPSMANLLLRRRASQPVSSAAIHRPTSSVKGSTSGLAFTLPPQGEDTEMQESDDVSTNNTDPVNTEAIAVYI